MTVLHPSAKLFSLLTEPSWREALGAEFKTPYMVRIAEALVEAERRVEAGGPELAPKRADIFRALNLVPVAKVRAVIVGQDPYPIQGDADGLAFSYRGDGRTPNALGKVLAEARREFGWRKKPSRDLTPWAEQGVLLLNVALSNLVGQTWAHGTLAGSSSRRRCFARSRIVRRHRLSCCGEAKQQSFRASSKEHSTRC